MTTHPPTIILRKGQRSIQGCSVDLLVQSHVSVSMADLRVSNFFCLACFCS